MEKTEKKEEVKKDDKTRASRANSKGGSFDKKKGFQKKNFKKRTKGPRKEKQRSEFEQKVIDIRRVARVMAGGRRFSFRVTMIAGDMKGRVGVGTDKGADTAIAIEKATNQAKKNMIKIDLTESGSIKKETKAKYNASGVIIKPSPGKGIVAGSSVRSVLQIAGVTDVVAKLLSRSGNKLNNARAALKALDNLSK